MNYCTLKKVEAIFQPLLKKYRRAKAMDRLTGTEKYDA